MGLWHPFVVLEMSHREFWNATHWVTRIEKCLYSLPLLHIFYLLPGNIHRLLVSKVNVRISFTSKQFSGKGLEKVFMSLFLGDGPFRENLNYISKLPILHWCFGQSRKHFQSCKPGRFYHQWCLGQCISSILHFLCTKLFIHWLWFHERECFQGWLFHITRKGSRPAR